MSTRGAVLTTAAVIVILAGGAAFAAPPVVVDAADAASGVVVDVDADACPSIDQVALRRFVGIEIGDLLLPPPSTARLPAEERLTIRCEGDRIHMVVVAANVAPVARSLKASDFPGDAAPRALALAGIEMLAALSPTVRRRIDARQGTAGAATGKPPAPAPAASAPAATRAPAAPEEPPPDDANTAANVAEATGEASAPPAGGPAAEARSPSVPASGATPEDTTGTSSRSPPRAEMLVGLAVVRRAFLAAGGVSAWGANVGVDRELGARGFLRFDLEGNSAGRAGTFGQANALLLSLGGFFGARIGRPELTAVLAVGGRLGLVRLSGSAPAGTGVQGDSALRAWGGPALTARLLSGAGRLGLSLSAEAGLALLAAQGVADQSLGDPGVVVAVSGFWLTAGAGISF